MDADDAKELSRAEFDDVVSYVDAVSLEEIESILSDVFNGRPERAKAQLCTALDAGFERWYAAGEEAAEENAAEALL